MKKEKILTANYDMLKEEMSVKKPENKKSEQLKEMTIDNLGKDLTTNTGLKMAEDEFSLKAGERGPTLLEDFHFREKLQHFDHERIPERIVHARGTGAHGVFKLYKSMEKYTKANIFTDTTRETPIFARISTVAGSRGSADNVRDARGFAIKFYTEEGILDIVGNNIPVFFIQDAIKFPDFVHSVKPEPNNEMPQAASAHDTFWDFITQNQESTHMVFWAMSDRAIPQNLRMIDGFAVHTFRWINEKGEAHFVKYHWKPVLGVHSKLWDEAQKTNGKDPDFHRRDLTEMINKGLYPEWELGVQILKEEDEFSLDFDILDPTKLWPEEDVPVEIFGKITLNRNVDNFFAETEQVAFNPGHIVPGIDFSNDPLLQGRLFSYTDTQLIRLGGPNFQQIPINRPLNPVNNNQRDGYFQSMIHKNVTSYHNNSIDGNSPNTVSPQNGGYEHYQEKIDGRKIRSRAKSFNDFYSQPRMFYNSLSKPEQEHLRDAFIFELQMVKSPAIRQASTDMIAHVHKGLAKEVAAKIGTKLNPGIKESTYNKLSPALSQENTPKKLDTLKVAVWVTKGYDEEELKKFITDLKSKNVIPEIISDHLGQINGEEKEEDEAIKTHLTSASVLYDAAVFFGPDKNMDDDYIRARNEFAIETFNHLKPIGALKKELLPETIDVTQPGIVSDSTFTSVNFLEALSKHRFFERKLGR